MMIQKYRNHCHCATASTFQVEFRLRGPGNCVKARLYRTRNAALTTRKIARFSAQFAVLIENGLRAKTAIRFVLKLDHMRI